MVAKLAKKDDLDELIAESQRLKEELLKTTAKLEAFSDQLLLQVAYLRDAATTEQESDDDG